ncbi:hypothetical protein MPSEU_000283800 [Mayamaea pseudoterrestris]|nr:hypothetical protein MPSEU_000283800 [Mayamaea pseudoterrestris]
MPFTNMRFLQARRVPIHIQVNLRYASTRSVAATNSSDDDESWRQLLDDASTLSRSLYRRCFRSIRYIRHGNIHDEEEFKKRENERLQKFDDRSDPRLSMLSMLPPVNRSDELRSRAEYYQQYTRENFVQESDCLDHKPLRQGHLDRFVHLLRRGDDHRKWLLRDMKFDDPYPVEELAITSNRINELEERAKALILKSEGVTASSQEDDDDHDAFWEDDDDEHETQGLPDWYRNPQR